jgi:hypothetical protein
MLIWFDGVTQKNERERGKEKKPILMKPSSFYAANRCHSLFLWLADVSGSKKRYVKWKNDEKKTENGGKKGILLTTAKRKNDGSNKPKSCLFLIHTLSAPVCFERLRFPHSLYVIRSYKFITHTLLACNSWLYHNKPDTKKPVTIQFYFYFTLFWKETLIHCKWCFFRF